MLAVEELQKECEELKQWVDDLQFDLYINCVYCGYKYGSKENTPVSRADVLKERIEHCPKHPMGKLKEENSKLRERIIDLEHLKEN